MIIKPPVNLCGTASGLKRAELNISVNKKKKKNISVNCLFTKSYRFLKKCEFFSKVFVSNNIAMCGIYL